jgi:hypothetical protein
VTGSAVLSEDRLYRYRLSRPLAKRPWSQVTWIMLNPSTADAEQDDPTIRRCIGFTKAWGHRRLEVVNLFALRSPYPGAVEEADRHGVDIVGPDNDDHIAEACRAAAVIVCAWGSHRLAVGRGHAVIERLADEGLLSRTTCLGKTKGGMPRHPLYVTASTERAVYP